MLADPVDHVVERVARPLVDLLAEALVVLEGGGREGGREGGTEEEVRITGKQSILCRKERESQRTKEGIHR